MKKETGPQKKEYRADRSLFRTASDYEAAQRDLEKIRALQAKTDYGDISSLEKLSQAITSGSVRFESELGREFDDDIYALVTELRKNPPGKKAHSKQVHSKKVHSKKVRASDPGRQYTDEELKPIIEREMKRTERRRKLLLTCFLLVGVGCIAYFTAYHYGNRQSDSRFQQLSDLVGSDALKSSDNAGGVTVHLTDGSVETPDILPEYETLYNSNKKLIGWIEIDDTIIDYPVMQCDDNTYYLTHSFDQKEDRNGSIFLDYRCDVIQGNDNYILYGHHMSSGKMFAALEEYASESFYEKHPLIRFDTIYEKQTFQVMYVFRSRVYNEDDVVFKYYDFIDANSETEFNSYMNEMKAESLYDTGVTAVYGDQLLTLSTCDYNEKNGRFVVVAKRID